MTTVEESLRRRPQAPEDFSPEDGTEYFGAYEGFEFRVENLKNAALILADYKWTHPVMEDYCEKVIAECDKWLPDEE